MSMTLGDPEGYFVCLRPFYNSHTEETAVALAKICLHTRLKRIRDGYYIYSYLFTILW